MAKLGSVNYSVPAGADPLGIGVMDLGRSSYDPIAQVQQTWANARQDRMIKDQQSREDYKQFQASLPSFKGVNTKVASMLNQKATEMGNLAYQKYKSGVFAPWAKTKTGKGTEQELSSGMNELADYGTAFEPLTQEYAQAEKTVSDPKNKDLIDWEITNQRMNQFADTKNDKDIKGLLENMADASAKGLVQFKPQPIELNKWVTDRAKFLLPKEDLTTNIATNPETGIITTTEKTFTNPTKAAKAYMDMYNNADESEMQYKNAIDEAYARTLRDDPSSVQDELGNPIPVDKWFAAENVPQFANKVKKSIKFEPGDRNGGGFSFGLPKADDRGIYNLDDFESTSTFRRNAGDNQTMDEDYKASFSIPLQGAFKKDMPMANTNTTYDTGTGATTTRVGRSSSNKPLSIQGLPVTTKDFKITIDNKEYSYKKGEMIPERVFASMPYKSDIRYKAFLLSDSAQKTAAEEIKYVAGSKETSHNQQQLRPWDEVKNEFSQFAKTQGLDATEMANTVDQLIKQLNRFAPDQQSSIFKDKTAEEIAAGM